MNRSPVFHDVCVDCEENEDKDPSPQPIFHDVCVDCEENEDKDPSPQPMIENQFVSISNPTELERIESLAAVAYSKRDGIPRQVLQLSEEPDENGNHQLIKLHKSLSEASLSVGYKTNGGLSGVIPRNGSISTMRKGYRWQCLDKVENARQLMPPLVVVDRDGKLIEEFLDRAMQTYRHGLDSALTDEAIAIVVRNHDTVLDPCARPRPKVLRFETHVVDKSQADDNGKIPLPPYWKVCDSNYLGRFDKEAANDYHNLSYGGEEEVVECHYKLFVYDMRSGRSFRAEVKCKLMHLLKELPLCHHIAKQLSKATTDTQRVPFFSAMGKRVEHGAHDTGYNPKHVRASASRLNTQRDYCKMFYCYRDSQGRVHYVRNCACGHQGGGYCVRVGVFGFSFYLNTVDQIEGALECKQIKWDKTEEMRVIKEGLELIRGWAIRSHSRWRIYRQPPH